MASQRKPRRPEDDLVDWFTISYKSIYIVVLLVLAIAGGAYYHYFGKALNPNPVIDVPAPTVTTARFTSIEGNVKVKPVGVFDWYSADPSMVLRKSDLVRTGPGATAEITFFDGTVVRVRPDSLITIEDTSEDFATKRRRVAWHISSGEVNFQTGKKNVPGSATQISTPTVKTTAAELTDGGIRVEQSGDSDVKIFARSMEKAPDNMVVRTRYAGALCDRGEEQKALDTLLAGYNRHPESATISYSLALIYFSNRQFDDARLVHDVNCPRVTDIRSLPLIGNYFQAVALFGARDSDVPLLALEVCLVVVGAKIEVILSGLEGE